MKFNNLDELIRTLMFDSDLTFTVINVNDDGIVYVNEEPHHVTDNFNEQQAG